MITIELQQTTEFLKLLNDETEARIFFDKLGVCLANLNTQSWISEGIWKPFGLNTPYRDSWLALIHPDDKDQVETSHAKLLSGKIDLARNCYRIRGESGKWCWIIEKRWIWQRDQKEKPWILIGMAEDITEIKNAQEEAEEKAQTRASLNKIIKGVNSSLNLNETVNNILYLVQNLIPYDKAVLHVLHDGYLEPLGGAGYTEDREWQEERSIYPAENSLATRSIQERSPWKCLDIENEYPGHPLVKGTPGIRSWLGIPLIANGDIIGHISLASQNADAYNSQHIEIAEAFTNPIAIALENARMHGETFKLAMEDSLTKLGTRHAFNIQSHFFVEKSKRDGKELAVAMLDLDHFKHINDEFGHLIGDKVLQRISAVTRDFLRSTDLIARYGGEEIIILFPDTTVETASHIVDRICKKVALLKHQDVGRPVTLSAGISGFYPNHSSSLDAVIRKADEALYAAKAAGRNRIVVSQSS